MKRLILSALLLSVSGFAHLAAAATPDTAFAVPPDSARPWVYWFFMDGNLSRAGMTADLEAMAAAGVGGVIIMEVDVGIPRGPVEFMSDEWCALFKHAVEEAERLGLEITLNAGPGWTGSGGPWVKASQSMQHLVASETSVAGPARFNAVLPRPEPRPPYFGAKGLPEHILKARAEFYVDTAVLAFPNVSGARIEDIDEKALYVRDPYTSRPGVKPYLPARADYPEAPQEAVITPSEIIDLTDRLGPDGRLTWNVPEGEWTILRFGRRTTGANTRPAPKPAIGFESDKFDKAALEAHFDAFVGKLLRTIGPRPNDRRTGWTMLHIDSWEMGAQNWTDGFAAEFARRRGYDPRPWLPAMTGRIVKSVGQTERFLWDLRLTAQEMVIENHARHLKALGREHGFGLSIEPYDMNPTADMVLGAVADVPMCEFWSHGYGFDSTFSCIEAASVAHTVGRTVVAAEAFTAGPDEAWKLYPGAMKNQGDWALCTGINRIVFHRFAHQPWPDRRPGMTMGPYGVHWDRTQTWWPMVRAYHRYLARCQHLLRQGAPVADVCYLLHEGAPQVFRPPASALVGELRDRRGYNFDGCTPQALRAEARVEDGRVVFPGGAAYRLLVLPAFDTMTPGLLRKIKELVEAGATVVGEPPRKSPGLSDYPKCDAEVAALAAALWDGHTPTDAMAVRPVGKGSVAWGGALRVKAPGGAADAQWLWYPGDDDPAPGKCHFRRVFDLDAAKSVDSAQIRATGDNEFTLFVNGTAAMRGDSFHAVYTEEVAELLRPGTNVLAARVVNHGDAPNPAGFVAVLTGEYTDGTAFNLHTDTQWRAARETASGWRTAKTPFDGWVAAAELGPVDMAPWHVDADLGGVRALYPPYRATADLLAQDGVPPDFASDAPMRYIHRRLKNADLYFVANRSAETVEAEMRFRVAGKHPELWDPVAGRMRAVTRFTEQNGRTTLRLRFAPHQSLFVVFRKEKRGLPEDDWCAPDVPAPETAATVDGPWRVAFDPDLGGPGEVAFKTLRDWTAHKTPGIRHYSGIATYRANVTLGETDAAAKTLLLDLGEVRNMARVRLNGRDLGVVWCAPWRVDIAGAARAGENTLEIEVANLWPNRLIGDQGLPESERIAWTTWNPYEKDAPLLPSGLLGPVRVLARK